MSEGQLDVYSPDSVTMSGSDSRAALSDLLRKRLIEQRMDPVTAARVLKPIERTRRFAVTRTGEVEMAAPRRQSCGWRCRLFSWSCS